MWMFQDGHLVSLVAPGQCLDGSADAQIGQSLFLWDCNGYPQQNWAYDASGMQTVFLSTMEEDATRCMDILGGAVSAVDTAEVVIGDCTNAVVVGWHLKYSVDDLSLV